MTFLVYKLVHDIVLGTSESAKLWHLAILLIFKYWEYNDIIFIGNQYYFNCY